MAARMHEVVTVEPGGVRVRRHDVAPGVAIEGEPQGVLFADPRALLREPAAGRPSADWRRWARRQWSEAYVETVRALRASGLPSELVVKVLNALAKTAQATLNEPVRGRLSQYAYRG